MLFYQPIHELESRCIISAEALLRSRRETGEIRSALPLTQAAEEGPDLFRLDSWTMERAYADAAIWQKDGGPEVHLNVNLLGRWNIPIAQKTHAGPPGSGPLAGSRP